VHHLDMSKVKMEDVAAILNRLTQAFHSSEEDVFTMEPFFDTSGRVAFRIGAVVMEQGRSARHVFLYSWEALQQWVRQGGTNPCTNQALSANRIIDLGFHS